MLEAIAEAAAQAGRLALSMAGGDYRRWDKSPGHPVSEIDLAVDAHLRNSLGTIDADAGWLSEETVDDAKRLGCSRVWIVDPIDGTRDLLRGRSGWAVSVALVENGRPLSAVLSAPARGELWCAHAGAGASRNGLALSVVQRDTLAGARVPIDALPRTMRDLVAVPQPNSIALRIATVAGGEADLVATRRWGHEWDIAAAVLIAAEAGASVTDGLGAPLRFNKPDPRAFGVTISSPGIHAEAMSRFG